MLPDAPHAKFDSFLLVRLEVIPRNLGRFHLDDHAMGRQLGSETFLGVPAIEMDIIVPPFYKCVAFFFVSLRSIYS